jgi:hypothetical protein
MVPIDRTEDGFFEKQYPSQHPKRLLDTKILVPLMLKFYILKSFRPGFVHFHPFFLLTRILEIVFVCPLIFECSSAGLMY